MSEIPPVVVEITGDITGLLKAISDANTALTTFAQQDPIVKLDATWAGVATAIADSSAAMTAWAKQEPTVKLGATVDWPKALAPPEAVLGAIKLTWQMPVGAPHDWHQDAWAKSWQEIKLHWPAALPPLPADWHTDVFPKGWETVNLTWGMPAVQPPDWHKDAWVKDWSKIKLEWAMPTAPPPDWHNQGWVKGWEQIDLGWKLPSAPAPDWHNEAWVKGWEQIKLDWAAPSAEPPKWAGKPFVVPIDISADAATLSNLSADLKKAGITAAALGLAIDQTEVNAQIALLQSKVSKMAADAQLGLALPNTATLATDIATLQAKLDLKSLTIPANLDTGAGGAAALATVFGGTGFAAKFWKFLGFGTSAIPFLGATAGTGTIAGLMGFGSEHALLLAAGLFGSGVGGAIGAGILAGVATAITATGFLTDLGGFGQAVGDIKSVVTAQTAYNQAVLDYGAKSKQAAAAQILLNNAIKNVNPGAAPALVQAANAITQFKSLFDVATAPGESTASNVITQFVKSMQPFLGPMGDALTKNMKIIQTALQPFFKWLTDKTVTGGGGLSIFTELENLFTARVGGATTAMMQLLELVLKTIGTLAPGSGKVLTDIENFANKVSTPAGFNTWMTNVEKLITDFHNWDAFIKAVITDVYDLFKNSQGTAGALLQQLTAMLVQLGKWETSTQGKAQLSTIFTVHKQEVNELVTLIGTLLTSVGRLSMPLTVVFTGFANTILSLLNSIMSIKTDNIGVITAYVVAITALLVKMQALAAIKGIIGIVTSIRNLFAEIAVLQAGGEAGGAARIAVALGPVAGLIAGITAAALALHALNIGLDPKQVSATKKINDEIVRALGSAADWVGTAVKGIPGVFMSFSAEKAIAKWGVNNIADPLQAAFTGTTTWLGKNAVNLVNGLGSIVKTVTNWAGTNIGAPIEAAFNAAITWLGKNAGKLVSGLGSMVKTATTWVNTNVVTPIESGYTAIVTWLKTWPDAVMKAVNVLVSDFKNLGNSMSAAVVNAFKNTGSDIFNAIVSGLKAAIPGGSGSPLWKALFQGAIPLLAQGGLVTRPTLALVGEAGPEYVIPQSAISAPFGGNIVPLSGGGGTAYPTAATTHNVTVYANFQITSATGATADLKAAINTQLDQFKRDLVQSLRSA